MKRLIPIEDIKRLSVKTVALFLIYSYKLIQITCFSVTIQQPSQAKPLMLRIEGTLHLLLPWDKQ